jgi:hypothetical protein
MRRTLLAALPAALVALVLAAPAAAAPSGFYGVVPQTDLVPDSEFKRMAEGKVGAYRWPLSWRLVEKTKGTYDWTDNDRLMTSLAVNGIKPLPFVCCPPEFLHKDGSKPPTGAAEEKAWKEFLRAAVKRYGPNGEFWSDNPPGTPPTDPPTDPPILPPLPLKAGVPDNPITDWQILNEPNSSSFYHPNPDAQQYAHLLEISSRAIHDVDPSAYIVLGGMFGTPHPADGKAVDAWKFLAKLYKKGAKPFFDAAASHPYARNVKGIKFQIKKFRKVMKRHHDSGADLSVTEMGWGSKKNVPSFLGKGKKGQAEILKKSFRLLTHKRRQWNIRQTMWFTWKDKDDPKFCAWCDSAGLFSKSLKAKPAWRQFVKFTGGS